MNAVPIVMIVLGVFVTTAAIVIAVVFIRKIREGLRRKLEQLEMHTSVVMKDEWVNCFGFCRGWSCSYRGNGALALTKEGLFFIPALGQERVISFNSITDVSEASSHGGKTKFQKLLSVTFTEDGKETKAAWLLSNPETWISALRAAVEAKARSDGRPSPLGG